jgi:hypothetical protein
MRSGVGCEVELDLQWRWMCGEARCAVVRCAVDLDAQWRKMSNGVDDLLKRKKKLSRTREATNFLVL